MEKFSDKVIEILGNRKIPIPVFAKAIGLSATYTYNLLNGNKRWNAETMAKACKALEIKVEFKTEGSVQNG